MLLRDLTSGSPTELAVRPTGSASLKSLRRDEPVQLQRLDEDGYMAVHQGAARLVVVTDDVAAAARVLGSRPECRLAAITHADDDLGILRVWTFGRGLVLPDAPLQLGVSEAARLSLSDRLGSSAGDSAAAEWLRDELLVTSDAAPSYLVAKVSRTSTVLDRAFVVQGRSIEVDVRQADGTLQAVRVAPLRNDEQLSTVLVQARLEIPVPFDDGTGASPPIATLLAEGGYLARWREYGELAHGEEKERAEELGEVTYSSAVLLPTGVWRFGTRDHAEFLRRLDVGLPLAARSHGSELQHGPGTTFAGDVESFDRRAGTVDLRPMARSSDAPPESGTLGYNLGGSSKAHQRQQDAALRLATGAVPMPELGPLLEMRTPRTRRVGRTLRWDSPAVRNVFGTNEPTPAQIRAIEVALNTPDIAIIQGPPGTGKTKVIAAVAARVAEETSADEASRRVLLTSFQHDAVDNVAARTVVFGLPTPKESRSQESGSWMRAWRQDRLDHATAQFRSADKGSLAELRSWIKDRREGYWLAPTSSSSTADLLDEVAARSGHHLPALLAEQLRRKATELRRPVTNERFRNLLPAVRSLRTTSSSYEDDGAINCRRVLKLLRKEARHDLIQIKILEETAWLDEPPTSEVLQLVRQAKDHLLEAYGTLGMESAIPMLNADVNALLTDTLTAIDERLRQEGKGIATVLARFVHDLDSDPIGVEVALGQYAAVVAATCQAAGDLAARPQATDGLHPVDTVIVDEAARANPLDLQIPLCLASRRAVLVGDQRQLPHIVDRRIAEAVATTEAEAEELEESLFGRLFRFLVAERSRGQPDRVVTLNSQFRMHPTLGGFVSDSFYAPYGEMLESPLGAEHFGHDLPGYEGRCAAWMDIPSSLGRSRRDGTSQVRDAEAEQIAHEVHRLMLAAPHLTFGVISFYRAQAERILEALRPLGVASYDAGTGALGISSSQWQYLVDESGQRHERLRVGTVDSFQGKEFDVVILSTVRTPSEHAESATAAFGHLVVENRLCVAMSRQRRLLIVAGDRTGLLEHRLSEHGVGPLQSFATLCDREAPR